jgi:hypothetical protein
MWCQRSGGRARALDERIKQKGVNESFDRVLPRPAGSGAIKFSPIIESVLALIEQAFVSPVFEPVDGRRQLLAWPKNLFRNLFSCERPHDVISPPVIFSNLKGVWSLVKSFVISVLIAPIGD